MMFTPILRPSLRAFAVVLCGVAIPGEAPAQEIGVVKRAEPPAFVERGGVSAPAAPGDALLAGDVLRTGAGGSIGVVLNDGAAVALGADSALELARFVFEPGEGVFDMVLRVLTGRAVIRSGLIGEQAPERIRVETPEMTIGVRGTRFAVVAP